MAERRGVIFVEARVKEEVMDSIDYDYVQAALEHDLSNANNCFELLEDILLDDRAARLKLQQSYEDAKKALHSLKVVEYQGPEKDLTLYTSEDATIKVNVYALYDIPRSLEENEELPQAEITPLPHLRFETQWDELIFEEDIKGDLIWMMTNILKFADQSENGGDVNPLILLHGPPGTGKTTLCQGLAQRISIRMNSTYKRTKLIQIKTATLLSKYYSESARQVDEMFTTIAGMCQEDPEQFVCVLIDEVESIASSREFSIKHGESQDSLRATNALLTGLDRTKSYPNVVFLCTSNMLEALDSAFLDRCGLKKSIDPPSLISQYEILRSRVQNLIRQKVIRSNETLPLHDDAILESTSFDTDRPGCKLLRLVNLIRSGISHSQSGQAISGRSLKQIPKQAILRYLRSNECNLDMALRFMEQLISSEYIPMKVEEGKRKFNAVEDMLDDKGRKRKWRIVLEEECDAKAREKCMEVITGQGAPSAHSQEAQPPLSVVDVQTEILFQKFKPGKDAPSSPAAHFQTARDYTSPAPARGPSRIGGVFHEMKGEGAAEGLQLDSSDTTELENTPMVEPKTIDFQSMVEIEELIF